MSTSSESTSTGCRRPTRASRNARPNQPIACGFLAARRLHQLDDALRCEWHLVDADAERRQRILDGRGDRGGRDHPPTLAAVLGERRRRLDVSDLKPRHLLGGGQEVIHEAGGERLPVGVVRALLVEGHPDAWVMPPVIWPRRLLGLTMVPTSWTAT